MKKFCEKAFVIIRSYFFSYINGVLNTPYGRFVICSTFFLSYLLCFAPGGMSPNSCTQFNQAVSGNFSCWHPPVMACLWRILLFFQQGPLPFLTFHLLMLFIGIWLLSAQENPKGGCQLLWLILPLCPQVYGNLGMIWKDIGMALALFLAFALSCVWIEKRKKSLLFWAIAFASYALLVRYNAPAAILPPICVIAFFHYTCKHWIKATFVILTVSLFCVFIPFAFNHAVGSDNGNGPEGLTLIDEIAAASHYAKKNLFNKKFDVSSLPVADLPFHPMEKGASWYYNPNRISKSLLLKNVLEVIQTHPVAWLRAKMHLFAYASSFPYQQKDAWAYYIIKEAPEHVHKSALRNILKKVVKKGMDSKFTRLFFLPIFWAPLGMVIFVAGWRRKDMPGLKMMALSSSGLGYYASYLLANATPDYRYFYWLILSVLSAMIVWLYAPPCRRGAQ